jgi:hypothetical protein
MIGVQRTILRRVASAEFSRRFNAGYAVVKILFRRVATAEFSLAVSTLAALPKT